MTYYKNKLTPEEWLKRHQLKQKKKQLHKLFINAKISRANRKIKVKLPIEIRNYDHRELGNKTMKQISEMN